ncbi:MAG TPA: M2 family metallopeptidase, partial [Vicinamibacteria bacterium]|nr:M2 family metallopeptidase [Vicinamibacteria bacterium]
MLRHHPRGLVAAALLLTAGPLSAQTKPAAAAKAPTAAEAQKFVADAEARLLELGDKAGRAAWVQANFITADTEKMAADANKDLISTAMEFAKQATRFDGLKLSPELERKL